MTAFDSFSTTVPKEWVDYNEHLSEAFYVLIFGYATDAVMDRIGLGATEREATGASLYTVEAHLRYLREVRLGAKVSVRSQVVGSAPRKLHVAHEMGTSDGLVATEEVLGLYVAGDPVTAQPFPEAVAARVAGLLDVDGAPDWVGRSIKV